MAKRSLSSSDTSSESDISTQTRGQLQKRQRTQYLPNFTLRGIPGSIMGLFRPRVSSTQATSSADRVYPELPQPYSAPPSPHPKANGHQALAFDTGSLALEEGLSPQNPINLVEDEEESSGSPRSEGIGEGADQAGPSRLNPFQYTAPTPSRFTPSATTRPSRRHRPQVSALDSAPREYRWADSTSTSSSNLKTEHRRLLANHARNAKTGIRSKMGSKFTSYKSNIMNRLSAGRRQETNFMAGGDTEGPDSRARFQRLLLEAEKPTFDDAIKPQPKSYEPTSNQTRKVRQRLDKQVSDDNIADLLEKIAFNKAEADQLALDALDRLKPSIPDQLLDEEEDLVDASMSNPKFSKGSVKISSLLRLRPGVWLDDEIINHYGLMLLKRSTEDTTGKLPKVFWCNTFFYNKMKAGYDAKFGKWTKKVQIFDLDLMLLPINFGNQHWVCAAIDMRHKRVQYHDSMGDKGQGRHKIYSTIMAYLAAEHEAKLGKPFDATGWKLEFSGGDPQQGNGCDCGVFTCQTLENIARGKDLVDDEWEFSQADMPFFRRMMVWEIASDTLYKRW